MSELFLPSRQRVPGIIPPLLSFTAGFIDSFTVLALFGLFVAQVTGSFVLTAVAIVTNEQGALTKVLAVPVFLLAGVTTTVVAVMLERRGRAPLPWVLGLECMALTGFLLMVLVGAPLSDPGAFSVAAAGLLGLFAMGTQSATVRLLMKSVASTNVMTTNTTQIAIDAAELWLCLAGPAPRTSGCRARRGLRCGARPFRGASSDHAGFLGRDGGRHLGLHGDRRVGSLAAARGHLWSFRVGERARGVTELE
jgi:uncharacterized membrane protein YoaK (UPF0700 family)